MAQTTDGGSAPQVIVDVENSKGLLFVILRNIGSSAAYKVSVKFDNPIAGIRKKNFTTMKIFRRLEFLPPGKEIRVFLDMFDSYLQRKQPLRFKATITYYGKDRRKFVDEIQHDLSVYKGLPELL